MKKKIFMKTVGCNRREADSQRLKNYFIANNCQLVTREERADVIVLIACAFTKAFEDQCFNLIEEYQRLNAELIVAGCLPAIARERLNRIFLGKSLSTKKLYLIDRLFPEFSIEFQSIPDLAVPFTFRHKASIRLPIWLASRLNKKWHANSIVNFRISSGCLGNCAYCGIREAIGPLRSKPLKKCMQELDFLLKLGYRRIYLIGDDVGAYGQDINTDLNDFFQECRRNAIRYGITWEGISDMHPQWYIKYEGILMEEIRSGRIKSMVCAIQSGSARILEKMNRPGNIKEIERILSRFRNENKKLKISGHVIIGFPGETKDDFMETFYFLKRIRFDHVAIIPYSDRDGSLCRNWEEKILASTIQKRIQFVEKNLAQENLKFEILPN